MKTAIKTAALAAAAALAVVTVLIASACAPEIALTTPDWAARDEVKSAGYTSGSITGSPVTSSGRYTSMDITINGSLDYANRQHPKNREIKISFPSDADVLKASNGADIEGKMKEFLNFYTYTNATTNSTSPYTPSTLSTTSLDYEFVERTSDKDITVRLKELPNNRYIVAKVEASKYRRRGQTVDTNGDYVAGEVYDDYYVPNISVSGWATDVLNSWVSPVTTVQVDVKDLAGGMGPVPFDPADPKDVTQYFEVVSISGFRGNQAQENKILEDLLPKIKPEVWKYDLTTKEWAKDSSSNAAIIKYDGTNAATIPTDSRMDQYSSYLYVSFKPVDMGVYRLQLTDTKASKSSDKIGADQAVIIIDGKALQNTYVSANYTVFHSTANTATWETAFPFETGFDPASDVKITSDADLKNVVLEVPLDSAKVKDLAKLTKDEFVKAVSLVYYDDYIFGRDVPSDYFNSNIEKWTEVGINDVAWKADKRSDANNTAVNLLVIKLDPAYKLPTASGTHREFHILINNGLKYNYASPTPVKYFGDNGNLNAYKGTLFWKDYGPVYTAKVVQTIDTDVSINGSVGLGEEKWYMITIPSSDSYYFYMNDKDSSKGDGTKSGSIKLYVYNSFGSPMINGANGWLSSASSWVSGVNYLKITPADSDWGAGTYGIYISTSYYLNNVPWN